MIRKVAAISGWAALIALVTAYAAEIFGGAHAAFWHAQPPGYVETFTLICGRTSGCAGPIYVEPWVRDLNVGAASVLAVTFLVWLSTRFIIRRREDASAGPD